MNVQKRIEVERRIVRHLIRSMKEKDWQIAYVNDGGDRVKAKNETEAMDTVFSVDEAWIVFAKADASGKTMKRTAYIILGNSGWDCIADHSLSNPQIPEDDFEELMDAICEYAEDQE